MRRRLVAGAVALTLSTLAISAAPPAASASVWKHICSVVGVIPVPVNPCTVVHHGESLLRAGSALASGNVGGAVQTVASGAATVALGAMASWATSGARFALNETAHLIASSTSPRLAAPWFTAVYWRFAGVAVLLTLPFLFAAALQALIRSDPALLARSAFGYLPLAMLGVGVAAQLTALLLAATDELCAAVSGVAGNAAPGFLVRAGTDVAGLSVGSGSPFLAVLVSAFTVAGAIVLWLELVVRAAAVYVIVVMLPLAFAAIVWPARRVWALRAVELLMALILSKLAIVAVLTLGGAALEQDHTAAAFLTGLTLLVLGAFAPWAMLRFVPFAELAAGAAGRLRAELAPTGAAGHLAQMLADGGHEWASDVTQRLRRDAYAVDGYDAARSQVDRRDNGSGPAGDHMPAGGPEMGKAGSRPGGDQSGSGPESGDRLGTGSGLDLGAEPPAEPTTAPTAAGPVGLDAELAPGPVGLGAEPPPAPVGTGEHSAPPFDEELGQDGETRVSLLPDEVGSNGERRPGMAARWQAENGAWRPLPLGIEEGWSPVAWVEDDSISEDEPL